MSKRVRARSRAIDLADDAGAARRVRLTAPAWVRALVADTAPGVDADKAWSLWIVVTGWVLAVSAAGGAVLMGVAGLVAVAAPATFVASRRGQRDARVEAELPAVLDDVARALRSGASLRMAIGEAAARSTSSRADLAAIVDAYERGESLAAALDRWLEARPLPGVRLAVAALALAADTGGAAARAIDGVASTLRDRQAVARELRALSSQARLSAVVIAAAPIAFAAMAAGVDGATASFLLRTPIGAACLLGGLTLDSIAVLWMARLTPRSVSAPVVLGAVWLLLAAVAGRHVRSGAAVVRRLRPSTAGPPTLNPRRIPHRFESNSSRVRERRRRAAAAVALPEVVDLFLLAVMSGLTVPMALAAVAKRAPPPFAGLLADAVERVHRGERVGDALERLPHLVTDDLHPLVAALSASDRYGTPLAAALDRVAADTRLLRRRQAEEAARRVPVKLLFPLVFCTLPAFALLTVVPLLAGTLRSVRL